MLRAQKIEKVTQLQSIFTESKAVILSHFKGLSVSEIQDIRKTFRKSEVGLLVIKNTLAKLAVDNTDFNKLKDLFAGPVFIAYSKDSITAAKLLVEASKNNEKITIVGGMSDSEVLNVSAVKELAHLPSLDVLRAKIIGILHTPATRLATVLQAPAAQLARVVNAYASK